MARLEGLGFGALDVEVRGGGGGGVGGALQGLRSLGPQGFGVQGFWVQRWGPRYFESAQRHGIL